MGTPVDWLLVGLGNPGPEYASTRHNIGFRIADELLLRWGLPKLKAKYSGLYSDGRVLSAAHAGAPGVGGRSSPRVAILLPQTYMNEAGKSAGPARGALHVPVERILVLHDEIDLPFGEIRVRAGGGLAGHNGLKSLKAHLGSADFARVRVGVGRPDSTDPDRVAAYVLGRFSEPREDVARLISAAADATERAVLTGELV